MPNKGIQVKTYFGVAIPPRTIRPRHGTYTIRFVIAGWIPSKKNLHKAVVERKAAKKRLDELFQGKVRVSFTRAELDDLLSLVYAKIVNTVAYKEWEKESIKTIREQMAVHLARHAQSKGLTYPIRNCSISMYSFWKDRHARDTINKMESIFDLMVGAKCIADDDYFVLNPLTGGAEGLPDELTRHITTIDVTIFPGETPLQGGC